MADISPEINAFQNAVYGEEVRGSMISLAEKLNDEVEDATETVATFEAGFDAAVEAAASATAAASDAASDATGAATSASSAATSANAAAANATSKANAAQALSDGISAAETARASAETARRSAEISRANAEAARVTAETARAGSESNRQSAELTRQESETARNSAEISRVSAEATRSANETSRQSAETSRASAESGRVTEFAAMQRAFDDMSQQVLPPATYSTLGGVIIDQASGLEVDSDGTLSFTAGDFLTEDEAAATYATITTVNGKADTSHVHSAADITSGVLGVSRGGTGVSTAAAERERLGLGSTTDALPIANGGTGATTASGALSAILGGDPLSVANGGTGSDSLTANAVLAGNGTGAVNELATASGALYATTSGGAASFGTLPVAQGGTGSTTADDARAALGASRCWYATCSTAAATVAKEATCSGFVLEEGTMVAVRFANSNTAASATLNVNSTGAKAIYANNSTTAANVTWVAGETVTLVYDGTCWRMTSSVAASSLLHVYSGTGTTTGTGAIALTTFGLNQDDYFILSTRLTSDYGYALWRGDGYLTCFSYNMSVLSNTSVTVEVLAVKRR